MQLPSVDSEAALNFIVEYLKSKTSVLSDSHNRPSYGYDLFIPNVVGEYLSAYDAQRRPSNYAGGSVQYDLKTNSAPFYDAAWSLCQKGVLRPGTVGYGQDPSYGLQTEVGFALTQYGETWLARTSGYEYIPLEFGHFAKILADHAQVLGVDYHSRSQEALRCYRAQAYLACCTMCGASAEAILLSVALLKSGDEEKVYKDYLSAGGRTRIENSILGQQSAVIQREFRGYMDLLKYWRDNASHGSHSVIQESEAFISLTLLLRFAQFVSSRLPELTT